MSPGPVTADLDDPRATVPALGLATAARAARARRCRLRRARVPAAGGRSVLSSRDDVVRRRRRRIPAGRRPAGRRRRAGGAAADRADRRLAVAVVWAAVVQRAAGCRGVRVVDDLGEQRRHRGRWRRAGHRLVVGTGRHRAGGRRRGRRTDRVARIRQATVEVDAFSDEPLDALRWTIGTVLSLLAVVALAQPVFRANGRPSATLFDLGSRIDGYGTWAVLLRACSVRSGSAAGPPTGCAAPPCWSAPRCWPPRVWWSRRRSDTRRGSRSLVGFALTIALVVAILLAAGLLWWRTPAAATARRRCPGSRHTARTRGTVRRPPARPAVKDVRRRPGARPVRNRRAKADHPTLRSQPSGASGQVARRDQPASRTSHGWTSTVNRPRTTL